MLVLSFDDSTEGELYFIFAVCTKNCSFFAHIICFTQYETKNEERKFLFDRQETAGRDLKL